MNQQFETRVRRAWFCLMFMSVGLWCAVAARAAPPAPEGYNKGGAITEEMLMLGDPQQWAKPLAMRKPEYPADLIKQGIGGRVDVEMLLSRKGRVLEIKSVKSEPQRAALEGAVSSVIEKWTFTPAAWKDCAPIDGVANVRVWFEVKNGKGVISVSGRAVQTQKKSEPGAPNRRMLNYAETMAAAIYPATAARRGIEGTVYVVMEIEAATGRVRNAIASDVIVDPETFDLAADYFRDAALESARTARFAPQEGKDFKVCLPFDFKFLP